MITLLARRTAVVALLVCVVACEHSPPFSPSRVSQPPPTPSPGPAPPRTPITFPPLSGPSRTFVFDCELAYPVRDFTKQSRFVLFDNGAFVLEYPSLAYRLPGQYRATDSVLMFLFEFQGRTVDEAWNDATGRFQGDSLTIEFDLLMQHSDYENAVYVLSP
jgi:hypothetical protein